MDELLRRIVGIVDDCVSLHIHAGNVWFELFESNIVVNVNFKDDRALINTVTCQLDSYRLAQLCDVLKLIDDNIEVIKEVIT